MRRVRDHLKDESGIALVVAIIIIFVLVSASLTLLSLTNTHSRLSWSYADEAQAFALAETGLQEAMWFVQNGATVTAVEHLLVVAADTVGSYKYWLKSGKKDTIVATGFIPNAKKPRMSIQIKQIF